jgi:hypothetical protein
MKVTAKSNVSNDEYIIRNYTYKLPPGDFAEVIMPTDLLLRNVKWVQTESTGEHLDAAGRK